MATYLDIITDALQDLGYLGANVPLESDDGAKAFRILNDMLSSWSANGTLPGATPGSSEGDIIRIPRYSHAAVISNLAGRCSAPFKTPITPELAAIISATSSDLLSITAKIGPVQYPDTLPKGSGNACYDDDDFYSNNGDANF